MIAASPSTLDTNLNFFKEVLKLTKEEIDKTTQDVIEHFNTTYGLDFSESEPDRCFRPKNYQNATLFPFELPFNIPDTL